MKRSFKLGTEHQDLIHDVAYDYYGLRLATCSSDQRIKIWEASQEEDIWQLNDEWKAHDGSVLKVSWSHPEYGTLLASASVDRSVKIWEEIDGEHRLSGKRWVERAKLIESRMAVQDIEFAPRHLGLKLATCSADGIVRIYEAMDIMNVSAWTCIDDIDVSAGTNAHAKERDGFYSISWSTSRFHAAMFVVGCGQFRVAKVTFNCNNSSGEVGNSLKAFYF
jgi:nucleoporin SEH1